MPCDQKFAGYRKGVVIKMKKRKTLVLIISIVMIICLFAGCGYSKKSKINDIESKDIPNVTEDVDTEKNDISDGSEDGSENVKPIQPTDSSVVESEEDSQFSFKDISNLEFWFGSGVGAWCTVLTVNEDGTFEGSYHDFDMGDIGEGYPEGTCYLSGFEGRFTQPKKVDEYTYSVKIESIELDNEVDTEEIVDGVKYIYTQPYGLYDAEDILIYIPGSSIKELPEEYRSWVGYNDVTNLTETELPYYGLFNVKTGDGFSSYGKSEDSIDDELLFIEQLASDLEDKLQNENLTQSDMTEISSQLYQLWDNELNTIWAKLKETLDSETMATLTKEEREWISYKEDEIKKAGAEYEGGTMQPMVENDKGAELTKVRVYELAEYLR